MIEKIRVRIRASQTVYYDQEVEMTRGDWAELKQMSEDELCSGGLQGWLNTQDIMSADEIDDTFEMEVVDENGKAVDPPDAYGGA